VIYVQTPPFENERKPFVTNNTQQSVSLVNV